MLASSDEPATITAGYGIIPLEGRQLARTLLFRIVKLDNNSINEKMTTSNPQSYIAPKNQLESLESKPQGLAQEPEKRVLGIGLPWCRFYEFPCNCPNVWSSKKSKSRYRRCGYWMRNCEKKDITWG